MKKIGLFGIILAISFVGFAISLYTLSVTFQAQSTSNFMSDMMRNMMGGMEGMDVLEPVEVPVYLWILPSIFVGLLILGVSGLVYFLMVPEIRLSSKSLAEPAARTSAPAFGGEKVSTLLKTMKPDEKKVFEVLASHDGKYLQKHISKETDLSRLKTHRIIARFAERGIVTVRPYGNTNEVALSSWLTSGE